MKVKNSFPFALAFSSVWFAFHLCCSFPVFAASAPALLAAPGTAAQVADNRVGSTGDSDPDSNIQEYNDNTSRSSFISMKSLANLQLIFENFTIQAYWRLSIININKARFFYDLKTAFNNLARYSNFSGIIVMLGHLTAVFALTALLEWLFRYLVLRKYLREPPSCPLVWSHRIRMAFGHAAPEFLSLVFFAIASYVFYILLYPTYFSIICPFYLSILVAIIVIRAVTITSKLILSPANESIRLVPFINEAARISFRSMIIFISVLIIGVMTTSLMKYSGLKGDSLLLVKLFFDTIFISITGVVFYLNREMITRRVINSFPVEGAHQTTVQPAPNTWFVMLISYLFLIWLILAGNLVMSETQPSLAFSASILIIPAFLIMDGLIGWLFRFVGHSLSGDDELAQAEVAIADDNKKPGLLFTYLRTLSRLLLIGFLLLWILHLWGISFGNYHLIISSIRKVIFLFIIFFFLWQLINKSISSYLNRKEESDYEEDDDRESEWGGGQMLDRSQTLLPIARKFLGIAMLVLVVLFTLSSLGVNIGPLLAGAGVMGIAIGFGAQKLVSDLLSGFFFLVDDAFRVGEYIETSSIKGMVEKITLRNIMLRHHRGMLQIVPYSDLGAITNFMRGGIVVKFNLQFPYDTNVDMVRKVIKRVGKEMLKDPEFGENFIKQLKSQGIREVGDSVITIRVKFTAKPGTHFVIRREAYGRITKGLNEKGIQYAVRKFIVDVSEDNSKAADQETKDKLMKAGGAVAAANQQQEETPKKLK